MQGPVEDEDAECEAAELWAAIAAEVWRRACEQSPEHDEDTSREVQT